MKKSVYRNMSLTELENDDWGVDQSGSPLYKTLHELRLKPIGRFSIEDLRVMILQDVGLDYLVPIALDKLEQKPFSEGRCYKGDLLCSVLKADPRVFRRQKDLKKRLDAILDYAIEKLGELDDIDENTLQDALSEAINIYESRT